MQHDQGAGPSHLLSENSEQKKKERNDKFFAEMAYVVFKTVIQVHERNIELIKEKENASQFAYEQTLQTAKANELNLVILMQAKQQQELAALTKEQNDKLNAVKDKLDNAIGYIENLLKTMYENLAKQERLIEESKTKLNEAKQELAKSVEKHFVNEANKADFKPMVINVALPNEWKEKMYGAENATSLAKGYIEINKDDQEKLGKDIAEDLKNSEGAEFEDVVKRNFKLLVKNIIGKQIGIDGENSRELEKQINDKTIHPLIADFMKSITQNAEIVDKQKNVLSLEKAYETNVLAYQVMKQEEQAAKAHLEALQNNRASVEAVLNANALPQNKTQELDSKLFKMEMNANNAVKELEEVQELDKESLQEVKSKSDYLDDLLMGLEEETKSEENLDNVKSKAEAVQQKADAAVSSDQLEKLTAGVESDSSNRPS